LIRLSRFRKIIFIKHIFIGSNITKADLIEKIADASGCTKACAGKALEEAIQAITKAVKKGAKFALIDFSTFSLSKRKTRRDLFNRCVKDI